MQNDPITFEAIKTDIKNGNLNNAYNKLDIYLQSNLSDKRARNLKEKLRRKIYKVNVRKVKDGIKKSHFMWKEKRYPQILSLYMQLQQYAPNYAPLKNKIAKAYKLQKRIEYKTQDSALSKIENTVKGYLQTKNYKEAISFIQDAASKNKDSSFLQKMLLDTKRKVIDKKLAENKPLFKKSNPKKVYNFVKGLYEIEPTYFKIQKIYYKHHTELKAYYKDKKYLFEKDAKRQIQVLHNQGEYRKALQVCKELLRVHNQSNFAQKYIIRSNHKIDIQNYKLAYAKLNDKSSDDVVVQPQ